MLDITVPADCSGRSFRAPGEGPGAIRHEHAGPGRAAVSASMCDNTVSIRKLVLARAMRDARLVSGVVSRRPRRSGLRDGPGPSRLQHEFPLACRARPPGIVAVVIWKACRAAVRRCRCRCRCRRSGGQASWPARPAAPGGWRGGGTAANGSSDGWMARRRGWLRRLRCHAEAMRC